MNFNLKAVFTLLFAIVLIISQSIGADVSFAANPMWSNAITIVNTLGVATPTTQFSVFGAGGSTIFSNQFVGPGFTLTQRTTLTEIGAFVNNCKIISGGVPQCPGTLPFIVQIRRSLNGVPDASTIIASFTLSHDNDPFLVSFEYVTINLPLEPGSYFALFAPQGSDAGLLLDSATSPFFYQSDLTRIGYLWPSTGDSLVQDQGYGAIRILGEITTIYSLIATTERACALGWISSADVCKGLDDKLNAAKSAIGRGQSDTAKNQLNAFINQLDAQKGKAVNQQAYELLKADALYVIAHLP